MVAFTAFASAISIALLATTANAVPTVLTARQPPTTSAIDFTLYKTTQAGDENQCWFGVDIVHLAPADIGTCYTAVSDFYVLNIDHLATGYNCGVSVYPDTNCVDAVGSFTYNPNYAPCQFPSSSGLVDLQSWIVACGP